MLRRLFVFIGAVVLALSINVASANAIGPDITSTDFGGHMWVSPGLWSPLIGQEHTSSWSFSSDLYGIPFGISGSGSVTGFCQRATLSGTVSIVGSWVKNQVATFDVTGQWVGNHIVLTGSSNGWIGTVDIDVVALPGDGGGLQCLGVAANFFTITGIAGAVRSI